MKKVLFFIFFFALAAGKGMAQEKRELKWQDFMNSVKTTEIAKPVKTGEFTIFQISDINKFLYKVEIEGRVFELQTPIPTELQNLFRLTPQQLQQRETDNKVKEGSEKAKEEQGEMKNVKSKLVAGKAGTTEEVTALKQAMDPLLKVCDAYINLSGKLADDVFTLKSARNKLVLIAQSDRPFKRIQSMLNDIVIPDGELIRTDYMELKKLYIKVEAAYKVAKAKAEEAQTKVNEMAIAAGAADATAQANLNTVKESAQKIDKASDGIEEADQLITDEALLGLLDEVDFLYKELGNKNNFTVIAPPVQMDGDLVSYTVTITPSVTRTLGPNKSPMQFKFDIPAKRGLKVDFGVGPAFSFGSRSRSDKYYLKEDYRTLPVSSPDTAQLSKLQNKNEVSPGIAAMMHVYGRSGKWVGWGGSFGVGAGFQSTQDVNFSAYTGLCLVFGKREKVMLSGGLSWLRVDRIKEDQFTENKLYAKTKINIADVTEKVFKRSFFLCITYNLTNKVEVK